MAQENIRRLLQPSINRGLSFENLGDKVKIDGKTFKHMNDDEDYLMNIKRKDM